MSVSKKILYAFLCGLITICGLCAVWLIAIRVNISAEGIKSAMEKSEYYSQIEKKIKEEFLSYLAEENVQDILTKIPVKENINYILSGIDDNTVQDKADKVKIEVTNILSSSLMEDASEENIKLFSQKMSEKYVKTLLPVSYFSKFGELYVSYIQKINALLVCIFMITLILIVVVVFNNKSFKYGIVALYNIVILSIYLIIVVLANNSLSIGEIKPVLQEILSAISITVVFELLVVLVLILVANCNRYFVKHKK